MSRASRAVLVAAVGILGLTWSVEAPAVEASPPPWESDVRQRIAATEYAITWQTATVLPDLDAAWQTPNRAQGFRTYFTDLGIRVVPRVATSEQPPAWEWSLAVTGWGRPGAVEPAEQAVLRPRANRIEYDRGKLIEWYVNDPRGLKQGFTLERPPAEVEGGQADATSTAVWIELALAGTLSPTVSADGQAVDFVTPQGVRAIRYTELLVTDATGEPLAARMEGFAGPGMVRGIRIVFDDEDAVYPVTVDPLATSPVWTVESDQAAAVLGGSVSTAGDVNGDGFSDVIVAADGFDNGETNEGRAYVYFGSAAGLAATPAWTGEGDQADARFGYSVATAGDVNGDGFSDVIVGAYGFDNDETDEGRAFVYHGSAAGLAAAPAWTAESNQASSRFGHSVATAGDVNGDGFSDVIVGAPLFDNPQTNEGRAFVYHGSVAGLAPAAAAAAWTAEGDQDSAAFGISVATAGDVNGDGFSDVIVGAYGYDNDQVSEGRAFVYHGSAAGLAETAAWTAESNQEIAQFGFSVATAGDVNGDGFSDVIVGTPFFNALNAADAGRTFVYLGSAAGLAVAPAWTAASSQQTAFFGYSVAAAGDVNGDGFSDVIVGAPFISNGHFHEGGAFVYLGSAAGLAAAHAWFVDSNRTEGSLGYSVATAGDVNGDGFSDVIMGGPFYDNGQQNEGLVSVYLGSAGVLAAAPAWTAESNQASAAFGFGVATAGDVNGDGFSDVIVGASLSDNGQTDEGRAFVYLGSAAGLAAAPAWTAESGQAFASFGYGVATAGDVNGDGFSDVIVGAANFDNDQLNEGRAFVYLGSAAGLAAAPAWMVEGNQANAAFGQSVATAGDVNGDGFSDVIVGAELFDNGQSNEGRAFVYLGSDTGLALAPAWMAESDEAESFFGGGAATAGDVNGDGFSDVIVSARRFDAPQTFEGKAFVYLGSAAGLAAAAAWTAEGDQAAAIFGESVGTAGDVNGDGFSDVIVGAMAFDNGQINEGRVFVYLGSAAGLAAAPAWTAESDQAGAVFGDSAATAGDVNGDGFSDVIVGTGLFDNGQTDEGRAFVYLGSAAGLAAAPAWTAESDQAESYFGISLATAGDVNGDGFSDVIVGASYFDNDQPDEGRAFVYHGNDGGGLSLRPRQRRADDTAPIDRLGNSDRQDSVRLSLIGRSPMGRAKVALEAEIKPLGMPLDGSGTHVGSFADTGFPAVGGSAVGLQELIGGLSADTVQHWRVRHHYDPVTSPFLARGRWLTTPWNSWAEAKFRTPCLASAEVCDGFDNDCDGVVDNGFDIDGDGATACGADCDDANSLAWATPGEVTMLLLDADQENLSWTPPDLLGGVSVQYDTLRSTAGWDFVAAAVCLESDGADTISLDPDFPLAGEFFFYLARAVNGCPSGQGSLGTDSNATPRAGRDCP